MIQIAVLLKRLKTFGAINICLPVAVQQRLVQVTKLSFVIGSQGIQSLINAPRMALAVASMWRDTLGAKVRLRNEEWKVFVSNRKQRVITQVFRGGWIADVPDARNFLAAYASDGPLNWSGFNNAAFTERVARSDRAPNEKARNLWLHAAELRLLNDDAVIPLYYYTSKHLVSDKVLNYNANALDHHGTRWMQLKEPR